MNNDEHLRYPVGKFLPKETYSTADVKAAILEIEALPAEVEEALKSFKPGQLDLHYREGGWTARQVVHHLADSHMNAYIRFKWALTEPSPVIKAYNEKLWAETPEVSADPLLSLNLLKALHAKWVLLLNGLDDVLLSKDFVHPDTRKHIRLDRLVATYAWHGLHHLGHLKIVAAKS